MLFVVLIVSSATHILENTIAYSKYYILAVKSKIDTNIPN